MSTFEEVIESVILTYLTDHKHSAVANTANTIKTVPNPAQHILNVILELPNGQELHGHFYFSEWAINTTISGNSINSKIVLDFANMVESLKTAFALVYRNVKW